MRRKLKIQSEKLLMSEANVLRRQGVAVSFTAFRILYIG